MNEEVFNLAIRKFLKKVGIGSQREIEKAVRDALERGKLSGSEKLPVTMVLTLPALDVELTVQDEIALE